MPEVRIDLTGIPEQAPVEPGTYTLRCTKCTVETSRSGKPMIVAIFEVLDDSGMPIPTAESVFHRLMLVDDEAAPDTNLLRMRLLKEFLEAAGVPYTSEGFHTEDAVGATCVAILGQEETPEGRLVNRIKRFVRNA